MLGETFKAMGDETRREILRLLRSGSLSAGEIAAQFEMSAATVSHHLSVLREAGLIQDERRGKHILYTLNASVFEEMILWLRAFGGGKDEE